MKTIAEETYNLTSRIEQAITSIIQITTDNQAKCSAVSNVFGKINAEVIQFNFSYVVN
jgi:hypothetical protein